MEKEAILTLTANDAAAAAATGEKECEAKVESFTSSSTLPYA
jgi:hypothetical protein